MLVNDSGVELKSGSTTSSEFSELTSNRDPSSPPKEDAIQMLPFNYQQEEFLAANLMDFHCLTRECFGRLDLRQRCSPILPSVTSSSACAECLYTSSSDDEFTTLPEWQLFSGTILNHQRSFNPPVSFLKIAAIR
ncbi:hypothetical protein Y032_0490g2383 [Ancylostoma ceylanicum]|uniref:Uncharacterized protein n=1 Tax=Ancylostoma ceylanicum TaxID=53326 RepID=A0A016WUU8_9BILA|nr:hypothetical protein Y032_0490g2383 [Ancylostoma ceylanicum]